MNISFSLGHSDIKSKYNLHNMTPSFSMQVAITCLEAFVLCSFGSAQRASPLQSYWGTASELSSIKDQPLEKKDNNAVMYPQEVPM